MICLTYDEWARLGFGIIKGSKHSGRNDEGVCTFTEYQVSPIPDFHYDGGRIFRLSEELGFSPDD